MQLLEPVRGGQAYSCQITVARQAPAAGGGAAQQMGVQGAWAASSAPAAADSLPSTSTPCKLLVGCSSTDELLVLRQVVLERMESPTQVCPATLQPQRPPACIYARGICEASAAYQDFQRN